ncbi:hypothetical protein [Maribacter antarcticus]|uniref:hypothetical protein n=1 Tax=Maribacter antarcticus TaxID=505250 RepID=UPI001B803D2F|nr:hypothetical protein [Maribacter antarcticus]
MSGPKLQKVFGTHSTSKLLPTHRKRLLKQIEITYGLFKSIRPNDLADIPKEYQSIAIKLDKRGEATNGYTIYDKSGYVFMETELSPNIRRDKRSNIFENGEEFTEINTNNKQFTLEVQKLIKAAFQTCYLKSKQQNRLFSESIRTIKLENILPYKTQSKNYVFLERHLTKNQKELLYKVLAKEFLLVKKKLCKQETKKERETLENKFKLIGKVLKKDVFNVGTK